MMITYQWPTIDPPTDPDPALPLPAPLAWDMFSTTAVTRYAKWPPGGNWDSSAETVEDSEQTAVGRKWKLLAKRREKEVCQRTHISLLHDFGAVADTNSSASSSPRYWLGGIHTVPSVKRCWHSSITRSYHILRCLPRVQQCVPPPDVHMLSMLICAALAFPQTVVGA